MWHLVRRLRCVDLESARRMRECIYPIMMLCDTSASASKLGQLLHWLPQIPPDPAYEGSVCSKWDDHAKYQNFFSFSTAGGPAQSQTPAYQKPRLLSPHDRRNEESRGCSCCRSRPVNSKLYDADINEGVGIAFPKRHRLEEIK